MHGMPTGVRILDAREQLFGAAERVLLRDGPNALTSRAVTTEAGCAKGVLHRHFADFDAFLAELVLDRIARIGGQAAGPLAPTLIGAGHLLFADREGGPPEPGAVRNAVTTVMAGVAR